MGVTSGESVYDVDVDLQASREMINRANGFAVPEAAGAAALNGAASETRPTDKVSQAPDSTPIKAGNPDDHAWQDNANCLGVDPDLFFPERGASTREAKEVCRGCGVRGECLEFALQNGEKFGVWGGLSERERRRIRRQRAQAARPVAGA